MRQPVMPIMAARPFCRNEELQRAAVLLVVIVDAAVAQRLARSNQTATLKCPCPAAAMSAAKMPDIPCLTSYRAQQRGARCASQPCGNCN